MPANLRISEFVERAKSGGVTDQALVGMLTGRGWSEKEVYEALALHYERLIGMEIPRRGGGGTAARDAFLYLLAFSTLGDMDNRRGFSLFHPNRSDAGGCAVGR
jgi:hypothetical protein